MIPQQNREPAPAHPSERTAGADAAKARNNRFPVKAAAASLLAHGVLIALLANTPFYTQMEMPDDRIITMRLMSQPLEVERPTAQFEPVADAVADNPDASETEVSEPLDSDAAETPSPTEPRSITDTAPESDSAPNAERAAISRATLLMQLEQLQQLQSESALFGADRQTTLPWASSGASIRGVPGVRGWLSGYVGSVTPSAHSWKEGDGASRGRYVLASGTVVCTRRRAPTIDELMNPWKSVAVTMGSICGKERPEGPDFSNPRVQPPPGNTREPSLVDE